MFKLENERWVEVSKIIYLDVKTASLINGLTIEITETDYLNLKEMISVFICWT